MNTANSSTMAPLPTGVFDQFGFTGSRDQDFLRFVQLDVQQSAAQTLYFQKNPIPASGLTSRQLTTVYQAVTARYKDDGKTFDSFCNSSNLSLFERKSKVKINGFFMAAVQRYLSEAKNPKSKIDLTGYDQAINYFVAVAYKIHLKQLTNNITVWELSGFLKIIGIISTMVTTSDNPDDLLAVLREEPDFVFVAQAFGSDPGQRNKIFQQFLADPLKDTRDLKAFIEN